MKHFVTRLLIALLVLGEVAPAFAQAPALFSTVRITSTASDALRVGTASLGDTDLAKIDGVTCGIATASRVLCVDANLDITGIRNLTLTGNVQISSGAGFQFASRGDWTAVGDGIFKATNNAGTAFTRLILGTNDSSGVALKKSGANLHITTGNDGGFSGLVANIINAQTNLEVGSNAATTGAARFPNNTHLYWRNAANSANIQAIGVNNSDQVYLDPGAVGTQIGNGGPTIYGVASVLGIGGKTSSFPGLKRNGQSLLIRLADDSADASVNAAFFVPSTAFLGPGANQSTVGDLRLQNATNISSRNAANSGNLTLLQTNSSNHFIIGDDASVSTATITVLRGANNLIAYGGVTSSFPAWKRNSAAIEARLADDSAQTGVLGSYLATGAIPATAGAIRTSHANSQWLGRNLGNSANYHIAGLGTDADNEVSFGDVATPTRIKTSLATPSTLNNGQWWVECVGVSPARVCATKVQDGGSARTIASVTW